MSPLQVMHLINLKLTLKIKVVLASLSSFLPIFPTGTEKDTILFSSFPPRDKVICILSLLIVVAKEVELEISASNIYILSDS